MCNMSLFVLSLCCWIISHFFRKYMLSISEIFCHVRPVIWLCNYHMSIILLLIWNPIWIKWILVWLSIMIGKCVFKYGFLLSVFISHMDLNFCNFWHKINIFLGCYGFRWQWWRSQEPRRSTQITGYQPRWVSKYIQ